MTKSTVKPPKPKVPYSLYVVCPVCAEETLHKVLKGKIHAKGQEVKVDATVECTVCARVHRSGVKETKPIEVQTVMSWKDTSERLKLEMAPDQVVSVGDVLQDEFPLLVTAVETKVRRERRAAAKDIVCIWAKRYDKVIVKFSINRGLKASPFEIEAAPEDEFSVKAVMDLGYGAIIITSIKTKDSIRDWGSAPASDIVRIYGRPFRDSIRGDRERLPPRRQERRPPSRTQSRQGRRGSQRARR